MQPQPLSPWDSQQSQTSQQQQQQPIFATKNLQQPQVVPQQQQQQYQPLLVQLNQQGQLQQPPPPPQQQQQSQYLQAMVVPQQPPQPPLMLSMPQNYATTQQVFPPSGRTATQHHDQGAGAQPQPQFMVVQLPPTTQQSSQQATGQLAPHAQPQQFQVIPYAPQQVQPQGLPTQQQMQVPPSAGQPLQSQPLPQQMAPSPGFTLVQQQQQQPFRVPFMPTGPGFVSGLNVHVPGPWNDQPASTPTAVKPGRETQPELKLVYLPDPEFAVQGGAPFLPLPDPNDDLAPGETKWTLLTLSSVCKEFLSGRCKHLSTPGTSTTTTLQGLSGEDSSSSPSHSGQFPPPSASCIYVHLPQNVRAFPQEVCRDYAKQLMQSSIYPSPGRPLDGGVKCRRSHCRMFHGSPSELDKARLMLTRCNLSQSCVFVQQDGVGISSTSSTGSVTGPLQTEPIIFDLGGVLSAHNHLTASTPPGLLPSGGDAPPSFAITSLSKCVLVYARKVG